MAKSVLCLLPSESMTEEERYYYVEMYPHIDFETVDAFRPLDIIPQKLQSGIEIIIGRGRTAANIRKAFPNVHVVEIPITAYDVIRSINTADYHGKTIAVITNKANIIGIDLIAQLYPMRILNYLLTPLKDTRKVILDAFSKGADLVMGGSITRVIARSLDLPNVTFLLGPESMQQVLNEVSQVQSTIEIEVGRQGFINNLMDNLMEGVVAVDDKKRITTINAVGKRILGLTDRNVLGEPIQTLGDIFSQRAEEEQEALVTIHGNSVMLNRIPVQYKQRSLGTIFTLHESQKIEKMENIIRTEAYAKGHVVRYRFSDIIGESQAIKRSIKEGQSYAQTNSNILITGESGSGKEIFAQGIHHASSRRDKPFVAINCAALPNELLQSELFGYVEGAFTGASRKGNTGLFEIAHNGTLFLDEISEMDFVNQGNLLRVVQERYVVRLGSHKPIPIDTRIIAATNKNLYKLVQEGKFREDLYYRLNVLALEVPPLRSRKKDVVPLMLYFLKHFPSLCRGRFTFSEQARALLENHAWPGNVRELSNVAERIAATTKSPEITYEQMRRALQHPSLVLEESPLDYKQARRNKKRNQAEDIRQAIMECDGNLSEAARKLGINRTTLWRRMKRAGENFTG